MLRDIYKYLCVLLAVVFAAACADLPETPEIPDPQDLRYITFADLGVETKVTNDDITSQEFSIWIFDEAHKAKNNPLFAGGLKYDSASHKWRLHDGSAYVDKEWGTGKHLFLAYNRVGFQDDFGYLFFNSYYGGTFYLPHGLNMTVDSNYLKDVVCTVYSRNADDYTPVEMNFVHIFASLQFNVINNTGQKKVVSGFSVNNLRSYLYSRTEIRFDGAVYSTWATDAPSDSYVYSAENKELAPGESYVMFGSPVVAFPQSWSGTNDIHPTLNFSVDDVPYVKDFKDNLGTSELVAGRMYSYDINLTTAAPSVVISPTVTIKHVRDANDILTHSAVNLNLNLTDTELKRVQNLRVRVLKDGVDYVDQTLATVSSNEISVYKGIDSDAGYYYLPQGGDYQVNLTYNDGFDDQEVSVDEVISPAPTYTLTVDVSATSNSFTVNSMSVNIADDVLDECPLKGHTSQSWVLRIAGYNPQYNYVYAGDFTSSTLASGKNFDGWAPQSFSSGSYYQILPYVDFDGVIKEKKNHMNIVTDNKISENMIYPEEVKYVTTSAQPVQRGSDLEDDAMYVIRANWNTSIYWSVNSSTKQLVLGSSQTAFPEEYVFIYDRDATQEVTNSGKLIDSNPSSYKNESVGAWKSLSTGDYMVTNNGLFYFNESSASNAQYVVCANGWDTTNGSNDIDMCKDDTYMIVYQNNAFTWGDNKSTSGSNQLWKWNIYKVQAQ